MAALYPSSVDQTGETLPFVTFADFEAFGEGTREVSKASVIAYTPLLTTEAELLAWNVYSVNNSQWIAQGRAFEPTLGSILNATDNKKQTRSWSAGNTEHSLKTGITEYVYHIDSTGRAISEAGEGPFTPLWQMSPVLTDLRMVNFNLASKPLYAGLVEYASITGLPILSEPVNPEEFFGTWANENENGSPHSILVQPVYNGFAHEKEQEVVGTVTALLSWENFFEDVSESLSICRSA